MGLIAQQLAPNFASMVGIADIASTAFPGPPPGALTLAAATSASDGLWSLAVPIGAVVVFVVVVVAGVFVLRALITRRNPDTKEP